MDGFESGAIFDIAAERCDNEVYFFSWHRFEEGDCCQCETPGPKGDDKNYFIRIIHGAMDLDLDRFVGGGIKSSLDITKQPIPFFVVRDLDDGQSKRWEIFSATRLQVLVRVK